MSFVGLTDKHNITASQLNQWLKSPSARGFGPYANA